MTRYILIATLLSISLLIGFIGGSLAGLMHMSIAQHTVGLLTRPLICSDVACGYSDVNDRTAVDCSRYTQENRRIMVLLALGQSNSANHGETLFAPANGVDNFSTNHGGCYAAKDPLLGATGDGGSPWTRLGEGLINEGSYDRVLIVSIGVGGSKIQRWQPGGDLNPRIARTAKSLNAAGIKVTHIAWHQGESNSKDDAEEYVAAFGKVYKSLRDVGFDAPIFPAIATICFDRGSDDIRAAQALLPKRFPGVFLGANTDTLDRFIFRHDLCHLSALGLSKHAELWQQIFTQHDGKYGQQSGRQKHSIHSTSLNTYALLSSQ